MAEKTDDPVKAAKRMRDRYVRRIMTDSVIEEVDSPSNLPDAKRAIVKMLESRDIWKIIKKCKSPEDMDQLLWRCTGLYSWLIMMIKLDYSENRPISANIEAFGTYMVALGFIRGMQFGRELDSKTEGNVALLLRHPAIRKLLLQEPKASSLVICQALDKKERMPRTKGWSEIIKKYGGNQYGIWKLAVGETSVRTLITNARRVAVQDATFKEFASVASGVGDEGSITNKFRPKKYAVLATAHVKAKK
jgi:hypothetical protein